MDTQKTIAALENLKEGLKPGPAQYVKGMGLLVPLYNDMGHLVRWRAIAAQIESYGPVGGVPTSFKSDPINPKF